MPNALTPATRGLRHRRPRRLRARDLERQLGPGDRGIELRAVQARRNRAVVQRERHLDQPGHAGGAFGVADVRLDRADEARAPAVAALAEHRAERAELDRIAGARAGAVRLDVAARGRRARRRRGRRVAAAPPGRSRLGVPIEPLLRPSLLTALPRITA